MKLLMPEVFEQIAKAETKKEKIKILRDNDNPATRRVLGAAFHPGFTWDLPEGKPPFKEDRTTPKGMSPTNLWAEARLLYLFCKEYNLIKKNKREMLFIQFLEGLHFTESDLVIAIKDGKLSETYKGLNKALVKEAYPNFFE